MVTPAWYSSRSFWVISMTVASTVFLPVVRMAWARVWPTTSRIALCETALTTLSGSAALASPARARKTAGKKARRVMEMRFMRNE